MNDLSYLLNDDDVISTSESALMFQCTFKASEFLSIMESKLEEENLFQEGIECQLLRPNQSWTSGKFRIRLEFCPDDLDTNSQETRGIPTSEYTPPPTTLSTSSDSNSEVPPFLNRATRSVGMWS